jgi:hypothetical protein
MNTAIAMLKKPKMGQNRGTQMMGTRQKARMRTRADTQVRPYNNQSVHMVRPDTKRPDTLPCSMLRQPMKWT